MTRSAPLALAAALALAAPGAARGGAWTQAEGTAFVSAGSSYYRVDSEIPYEEVAGSLYGEYGWREGVTLGGALSFKRPVGESAALDGEVTLYGFARARLHVGAAGDPFSAQVGAEVPLSDQSLRPQSVGDPALDLRALYGRGFATPLGDAFVDLQAAVRPRFGADADELRGDFTAGVRPAPRWIALIQSFNTVSLRNADAGGDDFDVYKLAPSVGYEVVEGVTALIGVEREVAGRNTELGTRVFLSVWTTF